ncbi:phosphotransferase [Streptomyces zagrosensis]|uniref:phosphotransferase n=1 Tax=Streptomyces zagrosensis TaxID=1042984 RepID=UPI0035E3FD7B
MRAALTDRLAAHARQLPGGPCGDISSPQVLADRPDGTVVRLGSTVCKAHAADADQAELTIRLAIAAHPNLDTILLAPLATASSRRRTPPGARRPRSGPEVTSPPAGGPGSASPPAARPGGFAADPSLAPALLAPVHGGRLASLWPYGAPIAPDDREAVPWEALGGLLARLHQVPVGELPGPVPPMRGPAKVARALERLHAAPSTVAASPAARAVHAAARLLPDWARGAAPAPRADQLCHGDLHLGQLVSLCTSSDSASAASADARWLLIDVDDLGLGDPAWDLARPAAWFATGLLDAAEWTRLLTAYRAAGGPAAGVAGDPWPHLDIPARALTVQSAALGLLKAVAAVRELDEAEEAMVAACARMAGLPTAAGMGRPASA